MLARLYKTLELFVIGLSKLKTTSVLPCENDMTSFASCFWSAQEVSEILLLKLVLKSRTK